MGRPGNKRLQRALYGASPSSATGTLTTEGEGRYAVTRVTGSVINNGGNMRSGGFPRVGMGLAFLRRTRVTENCCFVGSDEDLKTQLTLANEFVAARTTAVSDEGTADTTLLTAAGLAATLTSTATGTPTAFNIAAEADAIKNEADALADYNAKAAVLADLTATKNTAAGDYVTAASNTVIALSTYNASPKAAYDLATYDAVVALEATALAAWLVA